ncbi:hypothetical protein ANCCEY_12165 [Ancylostoma ceylanicum]|uniref:Uncharacterized protein n=1 Tax=Ancylostoma ceylanicum TaxID=53326 RepID=A0A0D6LFM5_9BILA|nr:hypothetical protein ANCCEY_12165 [Ancylostoma ceylanicum]
MSEDTEVEVRIEEKGDKEAVDHGSPEQLESQEEQQESNHVGSETHPEESADQGGEEQAPEEIHEMRVEEEIQEVMTTAPVQQEEPDEETVDKKVEEDVEEVNSFLFRFWIEMSLSKEVKSPQWQVPKVLIRHKAGNEERGEGGRKGYAQEGAQRKEKMKG